MFDWPCRSVKLPDRFHPAANGQQGASYQKRSMSSIEQLHQVDKGISTKPQEVLSLVCYAHTRSTSNIEERNHSPLNRIAQDTTVRLARRLYFSA